jgi:hypothetical protein
MCEGATGPASPLDAVRFIAEAPQGVVDAHPHVRIYLTLLRRYQATQRFSCPHLAKRERCSVPHCWFGIAVEGSDQGCHRNRSPQAR